MTKVKIRTAISPQCITPIVDNTTPSMAVKASQKFPTLYQIATASNIKNGR